jgi:hypothetical protein
LRQERKTTHSSSSQLLKPPKTHGVINRGQFNQPVIVHDFIAVAKKKKKEKR